MTAAMPRTTVAVYRRTIHASLERIWENVLDWEHLPWLHRSTFGTIRLLGSSGDGWRAEATLRRGGAPFVLDVAVDRPRRCYHSRTVDGPGAGTDIVTALEPAGEHATRIHVEFHVPGVPDGERDVVGGGYRRLYARLWDEDEAMMLRRQAVLERCLPDRTREVEIDGVACRFSTVCPHLGGPLDDAVVDRFGAVTCPWHGYRFDVRTGRRVTGV
jgi:hypothetical protein